MKTRRQFLQTTGAVAAGFLGMRRAFVEGIAQAASRPTTVGYGALVPDPAGLVDLPEGFTYQVLSEAGSRMDDGFIVPGNHDGMGAFPASGGRTVLVRNHEIIDGPPATGAFGRDLALLSRIDKRHLYDVGTEGTPPLGGTTTLVYDTVRGRLDTHFLSLAGTANNCAGGPTPWGTWITCEETQRRAGDGFKLDHGYTFEVPADGRPGLAAAVPLRAMGRFQHEAVAVDPRTGIVYLTEDLDDGLIYRFIPDRPGQLVAGGRLQALAFRGAPGTDTRNWSEAAAPVSHIPVGRVYDVAWIDLDEVESPAGDLRLRGHGAGAAKFARGEGMWYGRAAIYFACTSGGAAGLGQVWRYMPARGEGTAAEESRSGRLELFIESDDGTLLENCDNLTVAPWGDLVLCEDGPDRQFIVGVTPSGGIYRFAHNAGSGSEFAGATFSPDGRCLFVNIQAEGLTLVIRGPWQRQRKG